MADLEWDDEVVESEYVSSSQAIVNSPSWDNVDLVNQAVIPTGVDVMGNPDYPENIDTVNADGLAQIVGGGVGGWRGAAIGWNAMPPVLPVVGLAAKPIGAFLGGVGGAFAGGTTGDLAEQGFYTLTDNDKKPSNWQASVNSAFRAGSEEALYEALGQGVVASIRGTWRLIKGKPKYEGSVIQDMSKTKPSETGDYELPADQQAYRGAGEDTVLNESEQYVPVTQMINDLIEASGGKLTASQVTTSAFINGIEALAAASWGGGKFKEAQGLTDTAITNYVDSYIKHFNTTAYNNLSGSVDIGELFQSAVITGQAQHSAIGGQMFDYLDTLYTEKYQKEIIKRIVPTNILDETGAMVNRTETQTVKNIVQPVSLKKLKQHAASRLKVGAETAGIPNGTWGGQLLEKIMSIKSDGISFKAAQELRSYFLAESRALETQFGEAKAKLMMGEMERILAKSLDDGAAATKNKLFITEYKKATQFWAEGAAAVKSKNIASLLKNDPEEIGRTIFASGNVTLIKEARIALNKSAELAKGTDSAFNANDVFQKMQTGYLESLIAGSRNNTSSVLSNIGSTQRSGIKNTILNPADVVAGEFNIANLKKLLNKNTPLNDTFTTAFTKKQQTAIKDFVTVLEAAQKKTAGAGDFMVKVGQAGLILDTLGVMNVIPGVDAAQSKTELGFELTQYTLTPYIVSRILTSPRTTRTLARAMTMSPKSQQFGGVFAQLMAGINEVMAEE